VRERERESGFRFFFQSVHKRSRLLRKQKLSDTVGTDGDFSLFFVLLIILPNLQDFTRPFFSFSFFFRKWRASAAASLNEARARTLAGAGIFFPSCFPFSSFLYKSTRREKMRIECRKQTHRYFIPPLHLSNWNPSSFFTCLCNLLERGERIVEKIVARIKKKILFLIWRRPDQVNASFPSSVWLGHSSLLL
jgi:hypothetical protein